MNDPIADIMRDAFVLTGSDEYPNDVAKQIRQQIGLELIEKLGFIPVANKVISEVCKMGESNDGY